MSDSIQRLTERLSGYCIFINDKYQILLIAPQKCGSTSILKTLYDQLVEPSRDYEKIFSHEYTKELCIHSHLSSTQNSTPANLQRIFADQNYKKILVTRDPIDRLCSSICSKYIIESTPFYQREIKAHRQDRKPLAYPYTNTSDFLDDFNEIANILLKKGTIYKDEKASHASPISEIIPREILPFFDDIVDITRKEGWARLKASINEHLHKYPDHPQIKIFPHVNENPLSKSRRFLSEQNTITAYERYNEDYTNLDFEGSNPDKHQQNPPSDQELKSLNTFISLANRAVDIFNTGKRTHTSQIKQLKAQEELSRRTAEELLAETHELKTLNSELKEKIESILNTNKTSIALVRAAETRIKNKNFRSAQNLLTQAYLRNRSNFNILLRLTAVSIKNPILRSLTLLAIPLAKIQSSNLNRDEA